MRNFRRGVEKFSGGEVEKFLRGIETFSGGVEKFSEGGGGSCKIFGGVEKFSWERVENFFMGGVEKFQGG